MNKNGLDVERCSILVVDDQEINRDLLSRLLIKEGFATVCAFDGQEALDRLDERLFDIVLLDIMMPEINGYEVLERMKSNPTLRHIPVVMISALDELESVVRCIESGADDYLTKPFNATLLKARVYSSLQKKQLYDKKEELRQQLENYNADLKERVAQQVKQITSAQLGAIFALSKLAESKDPETGSHLERMREYCKALSQYMSGLECYKSTIDADFVRCIYAASPLHDIGKVGIPDHILLKPGKLTTEEWGIIKMHSLIGADTLRAVEREHPGNAFIRMGIEIAEGHHEKWDGSGYPHGRKGEEIPLAARILALADVYDALTSVRCYKLAFSHEKSRAIILEGSGQHFDPAIVDVFVQLEEEFWQVRKAFMESDDTVQQQVATS